MHSLKKWIHRFEGQPFETLCWKEQFCWLAPMIGARLGYGQGGKSLFNKIVNQWTDEFIPNYDYRLLRADELSNTHRDWLLSEGQETELILLEPGLFWLLAKTNVPVSRRLRRFLIQKVMPEVGEKEGPIPQPHASFNLWDRNDAQGVALHDRQFKVRTLHRMIDALNGHLDANTHATLEVIAAELATGFALSELVLPEPPCPITPVVLPSSFNAA